MEHIEIDKQHNKMNLEDYSYNLPEELIAQHPANPRDSCKLMIVKADGKIEHNIFSDIWKLFKKGDVLVLNNTKVIHSKLLGKKESGSSAEVILILDLKKDNLFEAKIKTKNPIAGTKILFDNGGNCVIVKQKNIDTFVVKLSNTKSLENAVMPSPPYIKHILSDKEYQTVYSKDKLISNIQGSLACPTAGLHFTKKLLKKIESIGVKIVYITLHVSYGTFKKIDNVKTYVMDPEYYSISKESAKTINDSEKNSRLIVCGTTTLKALETSSKIINGKSKIMSGTGESKLFIYPPYKFKSGTDILITNFHLPKSTLLLLTSAFAGRERILKAYNNAVKNKYRFFSLGDSMIIYE